MEREIYKFKPTKKSKRSDKVKHNEMNHKNNHKIHQNNNIFSDKPSHSESQKSPYNIFFWHSKPHKNIRTYAASKYNI